MQSDTNAYDIGASQQVQDDFTTAASDLEAALARRDTDVQNAMAEYEAEDVSAGYQQMEKEWNAAGDEVKLIIQTLRTSLEKNDEVATQTMSRAKSYVSM